jgi:hypothetical protein
VTNQDPSTFESLKAGVELPRAGNGDGGEASDLPTRYGFRNGLGGVHTSRTMMLAELQSLLAAAPQDATHDFFRREIIEDNVLGKRTATTRRKAAKLLTQLYALDPCVTIFRAMWFLWERDATGRPLLALLCAAARDPVFRLTASAVLAVRPGDVVAKADLEQAVNRAAPGHFGTSTLQTTARNAASTWTQSGHIQGHKVKRRARPTATPASAAYALLLGYLAGASGQMLLTTFWAQLLDTPQDQMTSLAVEASARGWIAYRQSGQVIEVRFPELLTPEELETRREQD